MRIEWNISKKRGNIRPVLTYSVSLENHEKDLALPPVRIDSLIPKPEEHWQEHCYPDRLERSPFAREPAEFYELEAPSHKGRTWSQHLRLPWRENNDYPEVAASFQLLRDAVEAELRAAYASEPMERSAVLTTSAHLKTAVAPGVLAERFLRIARSTS